MRHLKSGRKLNRTSSHRKALMRNLVTALLTHERITTTVAKAKESRRYVDRMITLGKEGSLNSRRRALEFVKSREAVFKLFSTLAERYAKRNGGYTRIFKIGPRVGDNAEMAVVELVDTDVKVEPKKKKEEKAEEKKEGKKEAKKKETKKKEAKKKEVKEKKKEKGSAKKDKEDKEGKSKKAKKEKKGK